MLRLVHLPYSPWSIKARWALDHHGVEYEQTIYVSMLSEPLVRLQTRNWRGRLTAPLLLGADEPLDESLAIARYAERVGKGSPLFPPELDDEIVRWNQHGDRICELGRARLTARTRDDPEALYEKVPTPLRAVPGLRDAVGMMGVNYFAKKYGYRLDAEAYGRYGEEMATLLQAVREALGAGREDYLLDGFSFADIAVASALSLVRPHTRDPLGPASRRVWTDSELAERFDDLLRWRDELVAKHRP